MNYIFCDCKKEYTERITESHIPFTNVKEIFKHRGEDFGNGTSVYFAGNKRTQHRYYNPLSAGKRNKEREKRDDTQCL